MRLAKEIPEGGFYPRGYGVAWDRYDRLSVVCYPVPLNIVARFVRSAYFALRSGPRTATYGRLTPPKLIALRSCYLLLLVAAFWAGIRA